MCNLFFFFAYLLVCWFLLSLSLLKAFQIGIRINGKFCILFNDRHFWHSVKRMNRFFFHLLKSEILNDHSGTAIFFSFFQVVISIISQWIFFFILFILSTQRNYRVLYKFAYNYLVLSLMPHKLFVFRIRSIDWNNNKLWCVCFQTKQRRENKLF